MKRHFKCTACGKCCYGQLPLTWQDALSHVEHFPIALVWSAVLRGSKDFAMVSRLGLVLKLAVNQEVAVMVAPTSFLPASYPCPALSSENLCSIHEKKPDRCKTMPFYPYRDERFQSELLNIREGWLCDTSENAPVVFEENKIVEREDFDRERQNLLAEVELIRAYIQYMLKYYPWIQGRLFPLTQKNPKNRLVTSLSSFLTAIRFKDLRAIAMAQHLVLLKYCELTSQDKDLADFHQNYAAWSKEMKSILERFPASSENALNGTS